MSGFWKDGRKVEPSIGIPRFRLVPLLLIIFGMVLGFWFQNISTTLFLVILEKRASHSLAKSSYFHRFFSVFFECVSGGSPVVVFCCFLVLFGVALGVILVPFCEKFNFFCERGDLRFWTTVKRFGLILKVRAVQKPC